MRRFLLALALCWLSWPAAAQYIVLTACGTPPITLVPGMQIQGYVDLTGKICDSGGAGGGGGSVTQGTSPWVISGNLTNISGTISLPTGASTAALQSTGNTALSTLNTTLGTPAQANTEPCAGARTFVNGTTGAITDTTSTSIIASAGGSLRNCVSAVIVTNSHATVGTFVKILDGSTIIWEGYAAAVGGGFASSFPIPLRGTAATAVNCQPVTTGANVICSAVGYTGT